MKLNKHIFFPIFFLLCFVSSFGASVYKDINTVVNHTKFTNGKTVTVSSKESSDTNTNEFLFEENENENEDSFSAQIFVLPYLVTCFQYEAFKSHENYTKPLVLKASNRIYISVCNFRI